VVTTKQVVSGGASTATPLAAKPPKGAACLPALALRDRRYYTENAPDRSISYVGLDPGVPRIEPGGLVRLSLARWFQGDLLPGERCYLQVSGTVG